MNWTFVIGIAALLMAPLVSYIVSKRQLSGRIATSSADALWKESSDIRQDYREQLASCFKRIAEAEGRVGVLEGRNNELERENYALKSKVLSLETLVGQLRESAAGQQALIEQQKAIIEGRGI